MVLKVASLRTTDFADKESQKFLAWTALRQQYRLATQVPPMDSVAPVKGMILRNG